MKRTKEVSPIAATLLAAAIAAALTLVAGCDLFGGSDSGDPAVDYSPVSTVLGRGYDVFEAYADPEYIKPAILDFDALGAAGMIEKTALENTEFRTISGTSSATYQSSMGSSASLSGDYKFFSGSVGASFSSATTGDSENQYATVQARVRKSMYAVKNRTSVSALKAYLSEEFESDLADSEITPAELFKSYGTHAMTAVVMGARYDYNLAAKKVSSSSSTTMSGYAQASFASITAEAGFSSSGVDTSAFSTSETNVSAIGGDSAKAAGTADAFADWRDSIADDTVVFSDYAANGLVPIWEFCDDETRAAAIEAAYADWSDEQYENYVENDQDISVPVGKLRIDLVSFHNENVGDGIGKEADWLWSVEVESTVDGETTHRISSLRNEPDEAKEVGSDETYSGFTGEYTYRNIALGGTAYTFTITPRLEEEDGSDLGASDSKNNLFCTAARGPHFIFTLDDEAIVFSKSGGISGNSSYYSAACSTASGNSTSENISIASGQTKSVYLYMEEFEDANPGNWVEFRLRLTWTIE